MVNRIKSPIRDLKQRLRKVLVRWREVILFSPPELVIREFKIAKTSPKSVFAFLYSLSRLFQLAYFVKCWWTLLRMKPCSEPPRQRNVLKKNIHKKGRCMGKFRACLRFISLAHTTWWDDIFYEIFSFPSPKYGAHDRKMSPRKFPRMTKKGWNAYILRFRFKYTLEF